MQTLESGDIALHIRDEGPRDGRAVLFANSLGTDLRVWESPTRATADLCGAPFRLIADAGHLPCVEQPEATARLISDFLERTVQ